MAVVDLRRGAGKEVVAPMSGAGRWLEALVVLRTEAAM